MKDKFSQAGRPPTMSEIEEARKKREREEAAKRRREEQARDDAGRLEGDTAPSEDEILRGQLRKAFFDDKRTGREFIEADPPTREWVVQNLIPAGETIVLAAQGATGKGRWVIELMLHAANGWDFPCSPFRVPKKMKVLMVTVEDKLDELHRRVNWAVALHDPHRKWAGTEKVANAENLEFVNVRGLTRTGICIDNPVLLEVIVEKAKEFQPDLIVLDPITRMLGGSRDRLELNTQEGAQRIHAACDFISEKTGAAVLFCHHFSKRGRDPKEGLGAGSSSGSHLIEDLARSVLTARPLSKREMRDDYGLSGETAGMMVELAKTNYAPPIDTPLIFSKEPPFGALRYQPVRSKNDLLDDRVLEILAAGGPDGMDGDEWLAACRDEEIGKPTFTATKKRLEADGRLDIETVQKVAGKVGRKVYRARLQ